MSPRLNPKEKEIDDVFKLFINDNQKEILEILRAMRESPFKSKWRRLEKEVERI